MADRLSMQSNNPAATMSPFIKGNMQTGAYPLSTPAEVVIIGDRSSVDRPSYADVASLKDLK